MLNDRPNFSQKTNVFLVREVSGVGEVKGGE